MTSQFIRLSKKICENLVYEAPRFAIDDFSDSIRRTKNLFY